MAEEGLQALGLQHETWIRRPGRRPRNLLFPQAPWGILTCHQGGGLTERLLYAGTDLGAGNSEQNKQYSSREKKMDN